MQKNITITGKSSFIGRNIIASLAKYKFNEVDLVNTDATDIDFSITDVVIHLAAIVHQMKGAPEEQYFKINRDLAYDVAKRAKEQGVKQFIFMSTAKVYGESTASESYWNEESKCYPTDPYGKSKFEAEMLIRELEDDMFKVAIVRSPLVYGVGVKANMYNLVKLVDKIPILPLGGIRNQRSMVYIGNLIALLNSIIAQRASGIFIAGDRTPLSTSQLVLYISQSLGKKRINFRLPKLLLWIANFMKPSFTDRLYGSLVLDNINTNRRLNFNPPFSNEEGIREMVEWYRKK